MSSVELRRGVALSVGASALFALISAYALLLRPLDGLDIFVWRVIWTVPGALLLLALRGRWPQLRALVVRMRTEPRVALSLVVTAILLGSQQWLFLWAPLHGRMLDVSLGYFLLPLVMVLVGRFYYHERLDALQWTAVACAALGVAHELWATHAFSWLTLLVMLGYPPYFMLRRRTQVDAVVAFAVEMVVLLPVAVIDAWASGSFAVIDGRPLLALVLLPGLGVLSTLALASWLKASRMLPMALFGLLGYVEPVLLVVVSLTLLGEHLSARQLGTYGPIWLAVALVALHSARLMRLPD